MKEAGIDKHIASNLVRKSVATHCNKLDPGIRGDLSRWMGHSASTQEEHYSLFEGSTEQAKTAKGVYSLLKVILMAVGKLSTEILEYFSLSDFKIPIYKYQIHRHPNLGLKLGFKRQKTT